MEAQRQTKVPRQVPIDTRSMKLSKYRCVVCEQGPMRADATFWQCEHCGQRYPTVRGVPKLYVEANLGQRDRVLRDFFYNGLLGKYYQHLVPFLTLPVRPGYLSGWLAYALIVAGLFALAGHSINFLFFAHRWRAPLTLDFIDLGLCLAVAFFLLRHRYLLYLLLLAVPVKISLLFTGFRTKESFPDVHARLITQLQKRTERLQVLDIATGSCNSLYRHGWMNLNADYTGLDLSETMLFRGLDFMKQKQVPMDFVFGDAMRLPFVEETFDVVLNYGALNAYTDPKRALDEMARVTKRQGLVLFYDEQLHESASWVEKIYFRRVLSSHDLIHHCPVELIPPNLGDINVRQIYHFYYLCTCLKK
jgi:ubiquinone/menaquinone biosynthesis C-methylase UbiE/ribosomal protein L37AE/L43A